MRVVVTGASGKLGRAVVADLSAHGHEVFAVDRVRTDRGTPSSVVDVTDFGQVVEAFTGIDGRPTGFDAAVHVAAIPGAGNAPNAELFANNITATYNVFAAARLAGISKVVWASSETLLGIPFDAAPPYLPLDEEIFRPETTYSLVKGLEEQMAAQFARWDPELSILGMRFSNIMEESDYARFDSWQDTPELRRWNLWGYIDARDGAQAIRLGIEADLPGADTFVIAAEDTVMRCDTVDLLTGDLADVPMKAAPTGRSSLLSSDRARRVLGFEPAIRWLDRIAA